MRFIIIFISLFFSINASAQWGIQIRSNHNNFNELTRISGLENQTILPHSMELGVDYWFRLKNYRWEFYPEFSVERVLQSQALDLENNISFSAYRFSLRNQIYFLNWSEDCDCPTFSKQGNLLSDGLHVIFGPGVGLHNYKTEVEGSEEGIYFFWFGGIGLDLGITDAVTITPQIVYRGHLNHEWSALAENNAFKYSSWSPSIRLGFRLDYTRRRR